MRRISMPFAFTLVLLVSASAQASLISSFTGVTGDGNGSPAGTADFTDANTVDWAYFDGDNDTDANLLTASDYSSEPTSRLISDLSLIGSPNVQDSTGAHLFTWDNGVNIPVVTDGLTHAGGVQSRANLGDGYNWTVTPGVESSMIVDVYAGVFRAEGTLFATIVDGTGTQVGGTTPQSLVWSLSNGARVMHATLDVDLTDAIMRARALIDIMATDQANLTRASIGITHAGANNATVTATDIDQTDAILKDPDGVTLIGDLGSTVAADDAPGILSC